MCVNRHALRVEINTAAILMVEKLESFQFESMKNFDHPMDALANFNVILLEMQ